MQYIIFVTGPPYGTQNALSAFLFSKSLLKNSKYILKNIFFYSSGVYNANSFISPEVNESNFLYKWIHLKKKYNFKLSVCVNEAFKRGIISDDIAKKINFCKGNVSSDFHLVSLSSIAVSLLKCDRIVQF